MSNYFQLPRLMALTITGRDALAFCQSQFTADMAAIEADRWQTTAWCDPKGRVQAVILASVHEDHVDLVAPIDQAAILARLSMYAIGRQVSLSEPLPVAGNLSARQGDVRLGQGQVPARSLQVDRLAEANPEAERAWRIHDLCQAIPWLPPGQVGRHLPQFLGLEHSGGLSFRKGCFPGQEVVARVHYLGKVKYQLLGFDIDGTLAEEAETRLQASDQPGHADVLEHLDIEGRTIGLAVCPLSWVAGTPIRLSSPGGAASGRMVGLEGLCYYRSHQSA